MTAVAIRALRSVPLTILGFGTGPPKSFLIEYRLKKKFGDELEYDVIGSPKDLNGAKDLAKRDRYQFQWWATSLIDGARPHASKKKGADRGVDGLIFFNDVDEKGKKITRKIVIQVKSGKVGVKDIRELITVVDQQNAEKPNNCLVIGVFVTLEDPTKPMISEAVSAGFYHRFDKNFRKIQILTIEELFDGKKVDRPISGVETTSIKHAERHEPKNEQLEI